ncbi:MAG: hypothetical protein ACPHCJ_04350, partial [Oceanococcaceae bacterium]
MPCPFPNTARVGTGLALLLSSLSPCSQAAEASPYASTIALPSPSPSPAPESTTLEDLVVVGEKLGRTQQNTATSTAVLTEADLRARGEPAVRDLLEELVNVSLAEEGGLSIRGIAQDGAGFGMTGVLKKGRNRVAGAEGARDLKNFTRQGFGCLVVSSQSQQAGSIDG